MPGEPGASGNPRRYPATFVDGYWQVIVTAPNSTMMMFRTTDQLVRYTDTYNCWCSCSPGEQRFVWFTITNPNSDFLFQFDPVSGRMRGVELGPTAAGRSTWGKLRTHYR